MLELEGVSKIFRSGLLGRRECRALDSVDLCVRRGASLGLVGESGSGKTTLARAALRLLDITEGMIRLDGDDITFLRKRRLRDLRWHMQIVFQHPETALDPQFKLGESLREALLRAGTPRAYLADRTVEACALVNMPSELLDRYPSQVSGGEIQRAALARVLSFEPEYLFLDEPTSMLDVSVQAHILGLLREISAKRNMGMVYISHDLDVVRAMCAETAVLHGGKLVETGSTSKVLVNPKDEHVRALLAAWEAQREWMTVPAAPMHHDNRQRSTVVPRGI